MSGGSYDYAYSYVDRMSDAMRVHQTPLRIAFRGLLDRVAVAMKAVEWVDSGDWSGGEEDEAIRQCLYFARDSIQQLAVEATRLKNQKEPVIPSFGDCGRQGCRAVSGMVNDDLCPDCRRALVVYSNAVFSDTLRSVESPVPQEAERDNLK